MKKWRCLMIVFCLTGVVGSVEAQNNSPRNVQKIFVNPSNAVPVIHFAGLAANEPVQLDVLDKKGKIVRSKYLLTGSNGSFSTWIDDYAALKRGSYTLQVTGSGNNSDEVVINLN